LVEFAIYPLQERDESPSVIEGEDSALKSINVTTKEKEAADMA
jgi:hypothetical protein